MSMGLIVYKYQGGGGGGWGLQLIRGSIQEYVVSCGMITHTLWRKLPLLSLLWHANAIDEN